MPACVRLLILLLAFWAGQTSANTSHPDLSPQESAFIASGRVIRMCVDPDWEPFERIDEQGRHVGISADLIQLVAKRVGLTIVLLPVRTWEESLAASKAGRCQIMSFLNQTPQRDVWLDFTAPILSDPNVIITREEQPDIGNLAGLDGKTVALPAGTMVEERIRKRYPQLQPVLTQSEPEAIALVSERKADMTIRSLIVAAYAIKKQGLFNLKVAGQVPEFTNQLRIGVIKSEPTLRSILDKGVATLTDDERNEIINRHVPLQVRQGVDEHLLWQLGLAAAVLLGLGLLWALHLYRMNKVLAQVAVTDQLTGLGNRQKLDAALAQEIQRAGRGDTAFSVILLDVDHFKQVNDTYGHQVGDEVLVQLATLLRHNTRNIDVVGRWGGEEFLIVCPLTGQEGAVTLAENLRLALIQHTFPVATHCSASFGVATCHPGEASKDLIARADAALYRAKQSGRNRVEWG